MILTSIRKFLGNKFFFAVFNIVILIALMAGAFYFLDIGKYFSTTVSAKQFANIYYDVDYARRNSAQLFAELLEEANKNPTGSWFNSYRQKLIENRREVASAFETFDEKIFDENIQVLHQDVLLFYRNLGAFEEGILGKLAATSRGEKEFADVIDEVFEIEFAWNDILTLDRKIQNQLKQIATENNFAYEAFFYDNLFSSALSNLRNPPLDPNSPPGIIRQQFTIIPGTDFVQVTVILLDKIEDYSVTLVHPSGKEITSSVASEFTVSRYVRNASYTFFEISNKDPVTAPIAGEWDIIVEALGGTKVQFLVIPYSSFKLRLGSPQSGITIPFNQGIEIVASVIDSTTLEIVTNSLNITVSPRYNRLDKNEGGYKDLPTFTLSPDPNNPGIYQGFFAHNPSSGTYWYTFQANAKGKTADDLSMDVNTGLVGQVKIKKSSQVQVDVWFGQFKALYRAGDRIVVEAIPINPNDYPNYEPIVGASLTVTPRMSWDRSIGVKWKNLQELPMLDNGKYPDREAQDGIYTVEFDSALYPKAELFTFYVLVNSTPNNNDIYIIQYGDIPPHTTSEAIGF